MNLSELGHAGSPSNGSKRAFVEIVEGFARLVFQVAADGLSNRVALLHGYGCQPGQRLAILVLQGREITDDEYLRVAGNAEIRLHHDSSRAINGRTQLFSERGGGHARGPQNHDGR